MRKYTSRLPQYNTELSMTLTYHDHHNPSHKSNICYKYTSNKIMSMYNKKLLHVITYDYIYNTFISRKILNMLIIKAGPLTRHNLKSTELRGVNSTAQWVESKENQGTIYISMRSMIIQVIRVNLKEQGKQKIDDIPWFNNEDNDLENLRGRSDSYGHWFSITFLSFIQHIIEFMSCIEQILFSYLAYYQIHLMYTQHVLFTYFVFHTWWYTNHNSWVINIVYASKIHMHHKTYWYII